MEILVIFIMIVVVVGLVSWMNGKEFGEVVLKVVGVVVFGVFMVGYVVIIKVVLEMG